MTIQCSNSMMMYLLPMMLGRTFDMQTNKAGVDIFKEADLQQARQNPYHNAVVESDFRTITKSSDKREFLGISGDLALKISSGLVEVKGAGEYLQDMSNANNSVEILIRMKFQTLLQEIKNSARPTLEYFGASWEKLPKDLLGTHVVTSVLFGGEVFASVKFIAHKEEYLEKIKGAVNIAFSKPGAFNITAQGALEKVAQNVSSMAKMDIVYFANVPLSSVPSTLEGLKQLVNEFDKQVKQINDGNGVAICVGLKPLSNYTSERSLQFKPNESVLGDDFFTPLKTFYLQRTWMNFYLLTTKIRALDKGTMEDFNHKFDNLREAKTSLKEFVTTLPDNYPEDNLRKLADFSKSLNDVLEVFHKTIGNLDLEKGIAQLNEANEIFRSALPVEYGDNNRYTTKMKQLKKELAPKEDITSPRGVYVRWGKRGCGLKTSNVLYIGFIASFAERGIGGGTLYQCLPEYPHLSTNLRTTRGAKGRESSLSTVRYLNLTMYPKKGRDLNDKVASCSVCQSLLRPTVRTFAAAEKCPGDWTQEYKGYLVSTQKSRGRTEFVCLDGDADVYPTRSRAGEFQAYILPTRVGSQGLDPQIWQRDASVPCVVCSK